jgi:phenylpyruvate tautomerase PptA (4-oxalocrotonate tautomerase family)
MPFVNYMLSSRVAEEMAVRLKKQTAELIRKYADKEEQWLLIRCAGEQLFYFKGSRVQNGGVVEVKLVGTLKAESKREIVRGITAMLAKELGTQADSLYVIFTEVKGEDWGWNNDTFG